MAKVKIHRLADGNYMRFHRDARIHEQGQKAEALFKAGGHVQLVEFEIELTGQLAAEEVFDLFNNPARFEESLEYAVVPDFCTGDIAEVDGVKFVCCSIGWHEFN